MRIADAKSFKYSEFNSALFDSWTDTTGPLFHAQVLAKTTDAGSDGKNYFPPNINTNTFFVPVHFYTTAVTCPRMYPN